MKLKKLDGVNIVYTSNQIGMSNVFSIIFKIKKDMSGEKSLYADFSEGLSLGLESAPRINISTEALARLKDNLNTNIWSDTESTELETIQKKLISDVDLEITNKADFYYGFWLGVFNYVTRIK